MIDAEGGYEANYQADEGSGAEKVSELFCRGYSPEKVPPLLFQPPTYYPVRVPPRTVPLNGEHEPRIPPSAAFLHTTPAMNLRIHRRFFYAPYWTYS